MGAEEGCLVGDPSLVELSPVSLDLQRWVSSLFFLVLIMPFYGVSLFVIIPLVLPTYRVAFLTVTGGKRECFFCLFLTKN